jgi:hypothetical protein
LALVTTAAWALVGANLAAEAHILVDLAVSRPTTADIASHISSHINSHINSLPTEDIPVMAAMADLWVG